MENYQQCTSLIILMNFWEVNGIYKWYVSSARLEYRTVTAKVTGSNPVRTANWIDGVSGVLAGLKIQRSLFNSRSIHKIG